MKQSKTPSFSARNFILFFLLLFGPHLSVLAQVYDIDIDVFHITIPGSDDGRIITTMHQGDAPFTVVWTMGFNTPVSGYFDNPQETIYVIEGLSPGPYQVVITDKNGCEANGAVTVLECPDGTEPFAEIAYENFGLYVEFKDQSTSCHPIVEWLWDFDDGSPTSTEQHPTHTYQNEGNYNVRLDVTDAAGESSFAYMGIALTEDALEVEIDGPAFGDIGQSIPLEAIAFGGDNACSGGYQYQWNLGANGTPSNSTLRNPNVVYSDGGTKLVYVTVTDCQGVTAENTHTIVLEQTAMTVDFSWNPPVSPTFPKPFTSIVTGNVGAVNYQWLAPGATISNYQFPSPFITFPTEEIYQVSLQACDQNGCVSVSKSVIVGDGLIADFTGTPLNGAPPSQIVSFTNNTLTTSPSPIYYWQFGDGFTSTEENPDHEYTTAGCFDVSLTVTDGPDIDTEFKPCYVDMGNFPLNGGISVHDNCIDGDPFLVASISEGCSRPLSDRFLDEESPCFDRNFMPEGNHIPYNSYGWSSSHQYVSFTTNSSPCTYINLDPNYPPFAQAIANGEPITVPVKLIVSDFCNGNVEVNNLVTIYQDLTVLGPTAISACPEQEINLLPVPGVFGGEPPYYFLWNNTNNFLQGYDQYSANPVIQVPQTGGNPDDFRYRVTVRDARDVCVAQKTIQVTPSPLVAYAAPPGVDPIIACTGPSMAQLGNGNQTAMGGSGNYTYRWTPTDGLSNPTIPNPYVRSFDGADITYTLMVTDNNGCMAEDQVTVTGSYSDPIADAGVDYIGEYDATCFEGSVRIGGTPTGSGTDIAGELVYSWSTDNSTFTSTDANPLLDETINNIEGTTLYTVTVVDDFNQCYDTDEVLVQVRPPWEYQGFEAGPNEEACAGMVAGQAFQSSTNAITPNPPIGATPSFTYDWFPLDIVDLNSSILNPTVSPTADYPFATLTVTDAHGCSEDFRSTEWLLYESAPTIDITLDTPPEELCVNGTVCFDVNIDPNYLGWDAGSLLPPFEIDVRGRLESALPPPLGGIFPLTLNLTSRLYSGQVCFTPVADGENIFIVDLVSNVCGSSEASYSIQVTLPRSAPLNGSICNQSNGQVWSATYSAIHLEAANNCLATVPSGHNTDFVGGEEVWLYPGFHSQEGSDFDARISNCLEEGPGIVGKDPSSQSSSRIVSLPGSLDVRPNPFSGLLNIQYQIQEKEGSQVSIQLIDVSGKLVATILEPQFVNHGKHQSEFNGSQLAPGIYFIELISDQGKLVERVVRLQEAP